jgi:hypothetical protein
MTVALGRLAAWPESDRPAVVRPAEAPTFEPEIEFGSPQTCRADAVNMQKGLAMVCDQKLKAQFTIKVQAGHSPIVHPAQPERAEPGLRQIHKVGTVAEQPLAIGELAVQQTAQLTGLKPVTPSLHRRQPATDVVHSHLELRAPLAHTLQRSSLLKIASHWFFK